MSYKYFFILIFFSFVPTNTDAQKPISFLIGSCAGYEVDWNDKPTDAKFKIWETMLHTPTDFAIWMGDAVYYRNKDWTNIDLMRARNRLYRRDLPYLQQFLDSRTQYAVWDDHDFGDDKSHGDSPNKAAAMTVFKEFWNNPSYGTDSCKGVFFSFKRENCEFFMLDVRYQSNLAAGVMLGDCQMRWLQTALKNSTATFKFIVGGSQFLPENRLTESYRKFPKEQKAFLDFLETAHIKGAILCSGDVHQTDLSRKARKTAPPIYEFTCSPFTSFCFPIALPNKYRLRGTSIRKRNFGNISTFYDATKGWAVRINVQSTLGKLYWSKVLWASDL